MKLDPKTGGLTVGGIEIGPHTGEASFGATTRRGLADGDHTWMIIARFAGGRLAQITLLADDASFGTSWDDYTEEKERARRAVHDAFLVAALGPAQRADDAHFSNEWTLAWGRVVSTHDPRGGTTDVQILYT
ncbi:MAG TPA: hypothetical protein VGH87_03960 [Polyangiaceae bacterium]